MVKVIFFIVMAAILVLGGVTFSIYKTCDITYLTDKDLSPDGTYFMRAQKTACPLLDRYTTDLMITRIKHTFLERLDGSYSEDILILRGSNSSVVSSWEDNRSVKVRFSGCNAIYGKDDSWRDIKIVYDGQCSIDN